MQKTNLIKKIMIEKIFDAKKNFDVEEFLIQKISMRKKF